MWPGASVTQQVTEQCSRVLGSEGTRAVGFFPSEESTCRIGKFCGVFIFNSDCSNTVCSTVPVGNSQSSALSSVDMK